MIQKISDYLDHEMDLSWFQELGIDLKSIQEQIDAGSGVQASTNIFVTFSSRADTN